MHAVEGQTVVESMLECNSFQLNPENYLPRRCIGTATAYTSISSCTTVRDGSLPRPWPLLARCKGFFEVLSRQTCDCVASHFKCAQLNAPPAYSWQVRRPHVRWKPSDAGGTDPRDPNRESRTNAAEGSARFMSGCAAYVVLL